MGKVPQTFDTDLMHVHSLLRGRWLPLVLASLLAFVALEAGAQLPTKPGKYGKTLIADVVLPPSQIDQFMSFLETLHASNHGVQNSVLFGGTVDWAGDAMVGVPAASPYTVVVQADVCNGCGYCVPACPYGVIDKREDDGRVFKCTLCYDRLKVGEEPACAKACPTQSIQFGELDELRERADRRVAELHEKGVDVARLYGRDPEDGVGGDGAFFLLLDEPEVYGLPPDPVVTTRDLPDIWRHVGAAAMTLFGVGAAVFLGRRR